MPFPILIPVAVGLLALAKWAGKPTDNSNKKEYDGPNYDSNRCDKHGGVDSVKNCDHKSHK